MPFKVLAVTCLLFFGFAGPAAANVNDEFAKTRQYFIDGDYATAISAATQLLRSEDLSQARRADVFRTRGISYNYLGEPAKGLEDLNKAIELAAKNFHGDLRNERYYSYYALGKMDEAYQDMLFVVQNYPDDAQYFRVDDIAELSKVLTKKNKRLELVALLSALQAAKYVGPKPLSPTDRLYVDLLREYAKNRKFDEAHELLGNFTQARWLVEVRLDRDFEALWNRPDFSALLDVKDFPARELAYAQSMLTQYPKSLKAVADMVHALRMNGRNPEAVSMAKSAIGKLDAYEPDTDHELWLKFELGSALLALGRFEEVDAVLEPLTRRNLKKNDNPVNQMLDYGSILMVQGRTEKAMRLVKKTEGFVNNRGKLVKNYVDACSLQQTDHPVEARAILADMLGNDEGGVDMLMQAFACLNETEQLAAYTIKNLADEKNKMSVLRMSVKCESNPLSPVFGLEIEKRLGSNFERADVKKAVDAVGASVTFPGSCSDY